MKQAMNKYATRGRKRGFLLLLPLIALAGLLGVACSDSEAAAGVPGGPKTIYMSAIEYKGTATLEKEPFPTGELPTGGGYGLKDLGTDPPSWQVNAYAWAPETITVVEGDEVTLHVIGINGGSGHPSTIEGHVPEFNVKRGEVTTVNFTAGDAGVYRIICNVHVPSMVGHLVVLPASQ